MLCELFRGIAWIGKVMDKAEECAEENGFACDQLPCFKDSDDEDDEDDEDEEDEEDKEAEDED